MKLAGLVLLCLLGFLALPLGVGRGFSDVPLPSHHDYSAYVTKNVTDTGTYADDFFAARIICDHGGTYDNLYPTGVTPIFTTSQPVARRVYFKIGIITGLGGIPENMPPQFIVYQMKDLPGRADVVSVCNSFCSRVGQAKYDANLDFDGNGVINIRDVSTAARFFYLKFGENPT